MSYQVPYFPDPLTGEIIPDAVVKDTIIRITNVQGRKTFDCEISIFRDLESSQTRESRVKLSLAEICALAPSNAEDGSPAVLSPEAIARIHAAAVGQAYREFGALGVLRDAKEV